ncbi:MAG: VF530 family protein [Gallionella sp.]
MNTIKSPIKPHSLDGITLEMMVTHLSERLGWAAMATVVPVRCFSYDPSIKSSLKFLRRTPWAREKVAQLYLQYAENHAAHD